MVASLTTDHAGNVGNNNSAHNAYILTSCNVTFILRNCVKYFINDLFQIPVPVAFIISFDDCIKAICISNANLN